MATLVKDRCRDRLIGTLSCHPDRHHRHAAWSMLRRRDDQPFEGAWPLRVFDYATQFAALRYGAREAAAALARYSRYCHRARSQDGGQSSGRGRVASGPGARDFDGHQP